MPTRVKRPSLLIKLVITVGLIGFEGYLGYHVFTGTFGIESRKEMQVEMEVLKAQQASLQAEIDAYKHKIALFNPKNLDPDILTERARALLGLVHPDDIIIMNDTQV